VSENNQTKSKKSNGRGGARANAGRKAGSATKRTRAIADKAAAEGITPLEFMLEIMRTETDSDITDPRVLTDRLAMRFEAAKAAAPYIHPRLAAIEHTGPNGGPIESKTTLDVSGLSMEQLRAVASIRLNGE
jgi:hypothetical protein